MSNVKYKGLNLMVRAKLFSTMVLLVLLTACSTMSRQDFNTSYDILFPNPIDDRVNIKVALGKSESAGGSTMMLAGDTFVMVPNGQQGPTFNSSNQREYAKLLKLLLVRVNAFRVAEYTFAPDYALAPQKEEPDSSQLIVRFNNVYMGNDGWPTDIDVTVTLKRNGEKLFEKSYQTSSGIMGFGGCLDCYPTDLAQKKLNKAFLQDLYRWQLGH